MSIANLYAALSAKPIPVLCRHCRYAQWSGPRQELVGTCSRLRGGVCPEGEHTCLQFSREPGSDDELE